jgi:hypothetical protein
VLSLPNGPSTKLEVSLSKACPELAEWDASPIVEAEMPLQSNDVDTRVIDGLVKRYFGNEFTCLVTRNHARGRYVKGERPDAIGRPRKVFFLRLGYEVIGQFRNENGDVLEVYRDTEEEKARAFVEEYKKITQRDLRLHFLY